MADKQIVDLDPKLSVDGTELIEVQNAAGGLGSSFHTPLSNLIGAEGPKGDPGADGADATATAGTTTTLAPGSDATVVNSGTSSDAVFDFGIPEGLKGDTGDQGIQGVKGDAATADAGSTSTGSPGSNASVTNVGTTSDAVFNFTIPRGDTGAKGDKGDTGDQGLPGDPGQGVPAGGTTNQIMIKSSGADYDIAWADNTGGGAGIPEAPQDGTYYGRFNATWQAVAATNRGLPVGGTTNQVLAKTSANNYEVTWTDAGAGGVGDVVGPASAVSGRVATYSGTTGKLIADGGKLATDLVTGPASSTVDSIATFSNTTGKVLKDSGLTSASFATAAQGTKADAALPSATYTAADVLTKIKTVDGQGSGLDADLLDGLDATAFVQTAGIANLVTGPASATSGRIATYNGATGKLIADGGKLATDLVTGPASVTSGRVATFSGTTGKVITQGTRLAADLVAGPASSVDDRIAVYSGTTGKLLKQGTVAISGLATAAQGAKADAALPSASYKPYYSGTSLPAAGGYSEGDLFMVYTP